MYQGVEEAREEPIDHLHGRMVFLWRVDVGLRREHVLFEHSSSTLLQQDGCKELQICIIEPEFNMSVGGDEDITVNSLLVSQMPMKVLSGDRFRGFK